MTGISLEEAIILRDMFAEHIQNQKEQNKTIAKLLRVCATALRTGDKDLKADLLRTLPKVANLLEKDRPNDANTRTH